MCFPLRDLDGLFRLLLVLRHEAIKCSRICYLVLGTPSVAHTEAQKIYPIFKASCPVGQAKNLESGVRHVSKPLLRVEGISDAQKITMQQQAGCISK